MKLSINGLVYMQLKCRNMKFIRSPFDMSPFAGKL